MAGFQQIIIIGNLGRDPELRYTPAGKAVCSFSVAVTTKWGDNEHTEWFNCTAWDKAGEIINQYCAKGKQIQVVGTLKTEEYEKDGEKRKSVKLTVRDFTLLGGGNGGEREADPQRDPRPASKPTPPRNAPRPDADLPF